MIAARDWMLLSLGAILGVLAWESVASFLSWLRDAFEVALEWWTTFSVLIVTTAVVIGAAGWALGSWS